MLRSLTKFPTKSMVDSRLRRAFAWFKLASDCDDDRCRVNESTYRVRLYDIALMKREKKNLSSA